MAKARPRMATKGERLDWRQPDMPMDKFDYEESVKSWKNWINDCKEHVYASVALHGAVLELDYCEDDGWFVGLSYGCSGWKVWKNRHGCSKKLDEAIAAIKELLPLVLDMANTVQTALSEKKAEESVQK